MRDRHHPHLTSSMNLSLGASLTSSSLMAKIWSPGRSLSSEGPPARREGQGQPRRPGLRGWVEAGGSQAPPKPVAHRRGQEPMEGSPQGKVLPCAQTPPTAHPTCCHRAHHHWPLAAGHEAESVAGVALDRHLSERVRRQLPTFHIIAAALLRHHMSALQGGGQAVTHPGAPRSPRLHNSCISDAWWDIHRHPCPPLQRGSAQCPSWPLHQQLGQGDTGQEVLASSCTRGGFD